MIVCGVRIITALKGRFCAKHVNLLSDPIVYKGSIQYSGPIRASY